MKRAHLILTAFAGVIFIALACLIHPAYAEDMQMVDASTATSVTTAASYLRVTCPLEGEQSVTVTDCSPSRGQVTRR